MVTSDGSKEFAHHGSASRAGAGARCKAVLLADAGVGAATGCRVEGNMNLHTSPVSARPTPRPTAVFLAIPALCAALLAVSAPVAAQPVGSRDGYSVSTQDSDASVAPGRAGRLSDVSGQVWLFNPEQREWVTAERNRPLTSGDRLATDRSARAEVRVGSTVVRLDGDTELEVLRLDDDHLQLQLHRGAAQVQLRDGELAQQFEAVTAEGRFSTDRPGTYRFDRIGSRTQASALNGQLYYQGPQQALTIESGQRAEFLFDGNGRAQYAIIELKRDAFATWNNERDRAERDASISQRYVSPEMTGAEDLDRYGRWEEDPEYGPLWTPIGVASGWAPYTTGRWAWVQPWGWTWVDTSPWGFAPFHYGRWVQRGPFWAWSPGRYVARPVYAPALVGWVGGPPVYRPGVSINISIGVGGARNWYPLTPRDRYVPIYRANPRYERDWHRPQPRDRDRDHGRDHGRDRDERPVYAPPQPRADRGGFDRGGNPPPRFEGRPGDARPDRRDLGRPDDRNDRGDRGGRDDRRRDGAASPVQATPAQAAPVTAPPREQPGRSDSGTRPSNPFPAAPAIVNNGDSGQDRGRPWRDDPRRPDRDRDVRPAAPAAPAAPMAPAAPPVFAPPAPRPAPRDDDRRSRANEEVRQPMDRSGDGRYGGAARNDRGDRPDRPDRGNRDNNRGDNRGDRPDPRNGN